MAEKKPISKKRINNSQKSKIWDKRSPLILINLAKHLKMPKNIKLSLGKFRHQRMEVRLNGLWKVQSIRKSFNLVYG